MARVPWCGAEVYEAAAAFSERCLVRDDSLFTPGRIVSTLEHAEALQATVGIEDHSKGTFAGKLVSQLEGVQAEAIQLCAELLFVQLLGENDTGGAKKVENVEGVLGLFLGRRNWHLNFVTRSTRVARRRMAWARTRRDAYMRFLIRLLARVKSLAR